MNKKDVCVLICTLILTMLTMGSIVTRGEIVDIFDFIFTFALLYVIVKIFESAFGGVSTHGSD